MHLINMTPCITADCSPGQIGNSCNGMQYLQGTVPRSTVLSMVWYQQYCHSFLDLMSGVSE